MSEGPPVIIGDAPERKESGSYELALDAARLLHQSGVEDPFDAEDPRVLNGLSALEDWYHAQDLHMGGVGTPEKARNIVKAARIFLDAGFAGEAIAQAAMEKIQDEYATAQNEGSKEAMLVLGTALKEMEKEKMRELFDAKLLEAEAYVTQGKPRDAVGVLTLAQFDPRFKRLSEPVRSAFIRRRDEIKAGL
jgi:hypothetical protein